MKIFPAILTSASSGVYNWSEIFDTGHAKKGFFNLEYNITGTGGLTTGDGVTFAWSGCSTSYGIFTRSATLIKEGGTSVSGPEGTGLDYIGFGPEVFPFIKIGALATGTTTQLIASLIMH